MSAKLKVVPQGGAGSPPRSLQREALAALIADRDAKAAEVEQTRSLFEKAAAEVSELSIARTRAASVADGARERYAAHALDMTLGRVRPEDAPLSPSAARRRLEEAEDALETARAVRDGLNARLGEQKAALGYASDKAALAARTVLGSIPGVAAAVSNLARLQREVMDKSLGVQWLTQTGVVPDDMSVSGAAMRLVQLSLPPHPSNPWSCIVREVPGAARYEAAVAALLADADAVPEV